MKLLTAILFAFFFCLTLSYAINKTQYEFNHSNELASHVMQITLPHVKPSNKNQSSTEIFMNIVNNGKLPHTLVAATSPIAQDVQLHLTLSIKNNIEKMKAVKMITITPHHDTNLNEGGFHVMLIGLKKQLLKGEVIPLTLIFSDGSYLKVETPIA